MALTDKLRELDQRVLPGTREDGEDAEAYLRRVAASRAITPAQAGDVMTALREHLGVVVGDTDDTGTEDSDTDGTDDSDDADSDNTEETDRADDSGDSGEDDEDTDEDR